MSRTKRSRPSSLESSDLNAILTSQPSRKSSRPNSREKKSDSVAPSDPPISDAEFYLNSVVKVQKPKSQFERSYEEKLHKFLLTDEMSEFLALELEVKLSSSLPPSLFGRVERSEEVPVSSREETKEETSNVDEIQEEVIVSPEYVQEQAGNPDFVCQWLLKSADALLEQAHKIVLAANYVEGAQAYYTLIKAALKALHMVAGQYMANLQSKAAAQVYYKLAKIYLEETENYSTAELFVKKSMAIAIKHGLLQARVAGELLCAKILELSDIALLEPFLNERQEIHEREGHSEISLLFSLKRTELPGLNDAQIVLPKGEAIKDNQLRSLCLLMQSSIYLSQGSPKRAEELLNECRDLFSQMKDVAPQLKAMLYLQNLTVCTQTDNHKYGKMWVKKITDFINKQKKLKWSSWNNDGTIPVTLSRGLPNEIPFLLQWIGPDEFVPTFYLLSGLFYMNEGTDLAKTGKIFEACVNLADQGVSNLTNYTPKLQNFMVSQLTTKVVRLSVIKFMAISYQVWLGFMSSSDFNGIKAIHAFLESYNNDNFTAEELWYYKFLIPHFLYLSAMYHQAQGNLKAAKLNFLKVRNLTSQTVDTPIEAFHLQRSLGIGYGLPASSTSELYIYSIMHLLNISEYEFQSLSQANDSSTQHEQAIQRSRSFLASLHADMTNILEDPASQGLTTSKLFMLTYKSALAVFNSSGFEDPEKRLDTVLTSEIEKLVFLGNVNIQNVELLALYVLLRQAINLDQRNRFYGKCVRRITKNEDNGKLLSFFVYLEAQKQESSDPQMGDKIQRKIDAIVESTQHKIETARQSVLQKSTSSNRES